MSESISITVDEAQEPLTSEKHERKAIRTSILPNSRAFRNCLQNCRYLVFVFVYMATGIFATFNILEQDDPLQPPGSFKSENTAYVIVTILAVWSYMVGSATNNSVEIKKHPSYFMDSNPDIISPMECARCPESPWKPLRTHHCQICKKCVLKMDHHCPWLTNCVGVRSFASFLLLCSYALIAFALYQKKAWRILYLYFYKVEDVNKVAPEFFNGTKLAMFGVGFGLSLLFMLAVLSLVVGNLLYAFGNTNTLEGSVVRLCIFPDRFDFCLNLKENIYDLGLLKNFNTFFGGRTFFAWFSWPVNPKYDGYFTPNTKPYLPHEIKALGYNAKVNLPPHMRSDYSEDKIEEEKKSLMDFTGAFVYKDKSFKFNSEEVLRFK